MAISLTQNKRIAILGATSQIARDLILSMANSGEENLHLFARRPHEVRAWLSSAGLAERYPADDFSAFGEREFDAIINFVGMGNPAQIVTMGNAIFDVTLQFDEMALGYLQTHPACRYLFLSSGAVYGSSFTKPATRDTPAMVPINNITSQEWYGVAKLHAECRHRSQPDSAIIDIRVFNYFSRTQDISARFLITDILRSIRDKSVLKTSSDYIVRDFLHPSDFHRLIIALLAAPATNAAIDCYSRAPIDKLSLLQAMQEKFGLQYEISENPAGINATGGKSHYYSLNTIAADFGYTPNYTALDAVLKESEVILSALHMNAH